MANCTNDNDSRLSALAHVKKAKALLASIRMLSEFEPTNNIRFNVEDKAIRNRSLKIKG